MKRIFIAILAAAALCSCASQTQTAPSAEMSAIDAIMARRSIRAYKSEPVDRETMATIIKCGINAPSGINLQPWAVRVVDNPELLAPLGDMFRNAPTIAFLATPGGQSQLDLGMLAENMMISAQALGVGTCCYGGPIGRLRSPEYADFVQKLDLPADHELVIAIAFGYPDESPEARPRDESKAKFID